MWKEINIGPRTISVKQIIFWNKQYYSETNLNYFSTIKITFNHYVLIELLLVM